MSTVYSFDVFDTCLCRLCGEPKLLFEVLSLKVQEIMGERCDELIRQQFVAVRVDAGGRSLNEIYHHVAQRFPLPCSIEQMAELEMETEKQMLVPIVATRDLVDQLRTKGDVLFISDMYLPSSFIRERLIEHGFFKEGDRLFVSDEVGAWKSDGSLFRFVKKQENITCRHWHHYGDNRHGDYQEPRRMGIHAHHLHYDYSFYEEKWRHLPVLRFQFGAIAAGVSRAVRLQNLAEESQALFVSDITGPFMLAWVARVMMDAQGKGIRRLYFCARDVLSEYHIARDLNPLFPSIEVKYLFVSSQSLYNSPLALDYFRSVGLADETSAAIVDTCSSGKTLHVLNDMLIASGCRPVSGYFLMKMSGWDYFDSRACFEFVGPYNETVSDKKVGRVLGMRSFFELLFSLNNHGKTIGYEYHGDQLRPLLGKDDDDQWSIVGMGTRKARWCNDRMINSMTRYYVMTGLFKYANEVFNAIAIPTLTDFVDAPRKEYLQYLHHFEWCGKPFVGKLKGRQKGVWNRGNCAYALPSWVVRTGYSMMEKPKLRRKLNDWLGWMVKQH